MSEINWCCSCQAAHNGPCQPKWESSVEEPTRTRLKTPAALPHETWDLQGCDEARISPFSTRETISFRLFELINITCPMVLPSIGRYAMDDRDKLRRERIRKFLDDRWNNNGDFRNIAELLLDFEHFLMEQEVERQRA